MNGRLRTLVICAVAPLLAVTGACGGDDDEKLEDELLGTIRATQRDSHRFAYLDEDLSAMRIGVTGLVEDDFRYKARLTVDDKPLWDEVVSDDAVADRFLDPDAVIQFSLTATAALLAQGAVPGAGAAAQAGSAAPPSAGGDPAPTPPAGGQAAADPAGSGVVLPPAPSFAQLLPSLPEATLPAAQGLAERRWVLDPVGAPVLTVTANDKRFQLQDPFFDALTTLDYTFKAVQAADFVKKYDQESLEPVYKPAEDPFPKPRKDSGIERYDLKEPRLPSSNAGASSGAVRQIQPPSLVHFRKMAIYVKDGRVVEVREAIDVQRKIKDLARNYRIEIPGGLDAEEQVLFAVKAINKLTLGSANKPVRVRQMTLQLREIGSDDIAVALPSQVVEASLNGLGFGRGRSASQAPTQTATGSGAGASGSTTTSAPVSAQVVGEVPPSPTPSG